jgi:thioredoxin-related protein
MLRKLFVLALTLALVAPVFASEGKELVFRADYPAAEKQAKKENKAMVVEFETAWCPFCRAMERLTFKDPEVLKAAQDLILAKVDADTQTVLARKFRVGEAFPLFVFLDRQQKELFRLEGYHPPDSFKLALQAVADENSPLSKAKRAALAKPKDPALQLQLGDALYKVGAVAEAAKAYGVTLDKGIEGAEAERAASRRAEHCREAGEWSDAASLYRRLLDEHPDSERNPFYSLALIQTYLGWGKEKQAQQAFEAMKKQHPEHAATKNAADLVE